MRDAYHIISCVNLTAVRRRLHHNGQRIDSCRTHTLLGSIKHGYGNKDHAGSEYDEMTALNESRLEFLLDGPEKVCVVSLFLISCRDVKTLHYSRLSNILIRRMDGIIQR
ncbi:hypothetical protein TWF102_007048 [Orbilia oligospora]|uniref:Uncharacterized protein n=1 Tax=Orbilia oligospora TaxID=2813651 RepID=A0A7C8NJK2_ORBOL|nr:hypothetical protein TWF102_007048 [Orbilia oligospora]